MGTELLSCYCEPPWKALIEFETAVHQYLGKKGKKQHCKRLGLISRKKIPPKEYIMDSCQTTSVSLLSIGIYWSINLWCGVSLIQRKFKKIEALLSSPLFHRHHIAGQKKWHFLSRIATHIQPVCHFNHPFKTHSQQNEVNYTGGWEIWGHRGLSTWRTWALIHIGFQEFCP